MTSVFHGDRPISGVDEDRFGLGEIASRLVAALLEQSATKGFVLGIEGAWGSGKSSLLALVLERLRRDGADAVEVVEFRPWLVGDRDQLLSALFEDLSKAIAAAELAAGDATRSTGLTAKGVAGKARRYARHLGSASKLAGLAGLAVPGLGIVGAAMEKVAEAAAAEAAGPTLAAQKDELSESLGGIGRRIVVAVDDVDRLEPREVAELLRLVRSVADFPNVTYVLCYDGGTLAASIQTATGVRDGRAYLEKIVQTEVSVPRPESFALRRLFSTELATFAQCDGEVGQRLMQVVDLAGGRGFDTPRTVMRVLDSLRLFWRGLEGQVDLADLVWLRIMAVTSPRTYRWTEEYLDALTVMATGRGSVDERERAAVARRLRAAAGDLWPGLIAGLFEHSPRFDFLTHLLRDETFDHGIYGGRRDPGDAITTMGEFATIRDAMFGRYRGMSVGRLIELDRSASALYAWSQAGGREELVAAVAAFVDGDDARLVKVLTAVAGRSRDVKGSVGSLDPEGLKCFFGEVPALLEKLLALAVRDVEGAAAILRAVGSSLQFHNSSVKAWLEQERAGAAAIAANGGSDPVA